MSLQERNRDLARGTGPVDNFGGCYIREAVGGHGKSGLLGVGGQAVGTKRPPQGRFLQFRAVVELKERQKGRVGD